MSGRPHSSAVKTPMPSRLEPMLPTLVQKPFSDHAWLYEPKWDGWRALCFLRDGEARFISRKQNSLNERFPELRRIAEMVHASTAILDGEVTALDAEGLPDFSGLHGSKKHCVIVYYAFDLLYLNGYDLRACPLVVRKRALRRILPKENTGRIRYTDHVVGDGKQLFSAVDKKSTKKRVQKKKAVKTKK